MFTAISILTRIPVPQRFQSSTEDFSTSLFYFPLVGLSLGGLLAIMAHYLSPFFSSLPLAALMLFVLVLLTGALHLDGLADLCDGLGAGGSRARILSVMKESQIGAFGVIAVVLILLLKFSLFYELVNRGTLSGFFLMGLLSRWAMVFAAFLGKYPRKSGTGLAFIGKLSFTRCLLTSLCTMVICWLILSGSGLMAMVVITVVTLSFVRTLQSKTGGLTGDALGALNEISEVVVLIFVVLLP